MPLKEINVLKCILLCLATVKVACWAIDDEGCRTPDRGIGTCMLVKNCQPMVNYLRRAPTPLPLHVRNKLQEYTCGSQRGKVKICCPEKQLTIQASQTKLLNNDNLDVITSHRNFYLLPKECGYVGIPDRISHGENAMLGEYPWMALLSYSTSRGPKFKCGGTIINSKYILTAAHCIKNLKEPLLGVRVGEYDLSKKVDCQIQEDGDIRCITDPVQDLYIEKIIPHPNFNLDYEAKDSFNDIGLLRVTEMDFSAENVKPICLPVGDVIHAKLKYLIITGWGYTEKVSRINNILQKVTLPIIGQEECQKAYRTIKISNKQICANGKHKDTCSGDSGGPLQMQKYIHDDVRMIQYGIISFGGKICGNGDFPSIYTRVDSYMQWILDNIRP